MEEGQCKVYFLIKIKRDRTSNENSNQCEQCGCVKYRNTEERSKTGRLDWVSCCRLVNVEERSRITAAWRTAVLRGVRGALKYRESWACEAERTLLNE